MKVSYSKLTQYICAVGLITTSIVLAFIQVFDIDDINSGTLMYIAQAFLLAGSIFGLDYYVKKIGYEIRDRQKNPQGDSQQQPTEHQSGQ